MPILCPLLLFPPVPLGYHESSFTKIIIESYLEVLEVCISLIFLTFSMRGRLFPPDLFPPDIQKELERTKRRDFLTLQISLLEAGE